MQGFVGKGSGFEGVDSWVRWFWGFRQHWFGATWVHGFWVFGDVGFRASVQGFGGDSEWSSIAFTNPTGQPTKIADKIQGYFL